MAPRREPDLRVQATSCFERTHGSDLEAHPLLTPIDSDRQEVFDHGSSDSLASGALSGVH